MCERPCRRLTQNFATGGIVGHTHLKDDEGDVDDGVMILTLVKAENSILYLFHQTRPKPAYSRQGLGWDHWAGSFWGFHTVTLHAFGAQLGLDSLAKFLRSKCLQPPCTFKPRPHSPYQLRGDPKHQVPTCGRPVFVDSQSLSSWSKAASLSSQAWSTSS